MAPPAPPPRRARALGFRRQGAQPVFGVAVHPSLGIVVLIRKPPLEPFGLFLGQPVREHNLQPPPPPPAKVTRSVLSIRIA